MNKKISSLNHFLKKIGIHPLLGKSNIFLDFISIDDENEFNKIKEIYNKIKIPTKCEEIKTLSGKLKVGVDKQKLDLLEKIKIISGVNLNSLKKLSKEYKSLSYLFMKVLLQMENIEKIWEDIYIKNKNYLENDPNLKIYQ